MGKITAGAGSTKKAENLRYRYRLARLVFLIATVFGALNAAFLLIEKVNFYSPFAFILPYGLMLDSLFWTGRLYTLADYETYYGMTTENFLHQDTVYMYAVVVLIAVAFMVVCWALSKKHAWALIVGCAIMALDVGEVLWYHGFSLNQPTELVMHVLILIVMVWGIVAHYRLKFMEWADEDVPIAETAPVPTDVIAAFEAGEAAVVQMEQPVQETGDSAALHPMDFGAKSKILLACDVGEYAICYRRLGSINELAINNMVYDTVDTGKNEQPHELCARLDGHDIAVGVSKDRNIYVRFDGEVVKKKPR